jgi:hypothetical protein
MRSVSGPPASPPHRLCPVLIGTAEGGSRTRIPLEGMVCISCAGVPTIGAVAGRAMRPSDVVRAPEAVP